MIKQLLVSVSLLTTGLCLAAPLTPEQALNRIDRADILGPSTRANYAVPAMVMNTHLGEPSLYVFNSDRSRGYVVVSADDAITPLLAYSDNEIFDADNISPALRDWLDQYSAQIEYAREQGWTGAPSQSQIDLPDWTPVAPLVKTQWNQGTPYNDLCPTQSNQKCYTGCVATAMAQVMKYFNYPEKPEGTISYKAQALNQTLKLDMSTLTFDWANMIDTYKGNNYTKEEVKAVATLMMAAGYSVEMNYTANVSGAVSGKIAGAMVRNFGYDKSIRYHSRGPYNYTDWATMIYNNLRNVGPLIYNGNSTKSGGHSFVCDGYQSKGYFHFNWGWGGSGDGYYVLDALSPTNLGIGAGGGGFNFSQDIILNITPNQESGDQVAQSRIVIYGSIQGEFLGNDLRLNLVDSSLIGWAYHGISDLVIDLGAKIAPVDNPSAAVYLPSTNDYNINIKLVPGSYMPNVTYDGRNNEVNLAPTFALSSLDLTPGVQYKVTNVYRPVKGEWQDVIVNNGSFNYCYITKTGTGNTPADFKIENFSPLEFTCESLTLDSDLYNGIACTITTTVVNNSNIELTRGISLALLDENGKRIFAGDTQVFSLAPGEKITRTLTDILTALSSSTVVSSKTNFYMGLYDEETETLYYRSDNQVTMQPNPGRPQFTASVTIDNAKWQTNRYIVEDSSNIEVTTTISVTKNIFSYPMVMNVMKEENNGYFSILLRTNYDLAVLKSGETGSFTTTVNFSDATVGGSYYLGLVVNNENALAAQAVPFYVQGTGAVEELTGDAGMAIFYDKPSSRIIAVGNIANVEAYTLNGVKLAETRGYGSETSLDVSSLGKGIVLVTATDTNGQRKTIKLAL